MAQQCDLKLIIAEEVRAHLESVDELGDVALALLLSGVVLDCKLDEVGYHQAVEDR